MVCTFSSRHIIPASVIWQDVFKYRQNSVDSYGLVLCAINAARNVSVPADNKPCVNHNLETDLFALFWQHRCGFSQSALDFMFVFGS
jgi:hypothetical protein